MPRLAALAIVAMSLSGCATAGSETVGLEACPSFVAYGREFQARGGGTRSAAGEFGNRRDAERLRRHAGSSAGVQPSVTVSSAMKRWHPVCWMTAAPVSIGFEALLQVEGAQGIATFIDGARLDFGSDAVPVAIYSRRNFVRRCPDGQQSPFAYVTRDGFDVAPGCLHGFTIAADAPQHDRLIQRPSQIGFNRGAILPIAVSLLAGCARDPSDGFPPTQSICIRCQLSNPKAAPSALLCAHGCVMQTACYRFFF